MFSEILTRFCQKNLAYALTSQALMLCWWTLTNFDRKVEIKINFFFFQSALNDEVTKGN